MTLFMGKKPNGDPLIHLTSGTERGEELRGDPIDNSTLFHTDYPYISAIANFRFTRAQYFRTITRSDPQGRQVPWVQQYGFVIDEDTLRQVEVYLDQGYLVSINGIVAENGTYRAGFPEEDDNYSRNYVRYGDLQGIANPGYRNNPGFPTLHLLNPLGGNLGRAEHSSPVPINSTFYGSGEVIGSYNRRNQQGIGATNVGNVQEDYEIRTTGGLTSGVASGSSSLSGFFEGFNRSGSVDTSYFINNTATFRELLDRAVENGSRPTRMLSAFNLTVPWLQTPEIQYIDWNPNYDPNINPELPPEAGQKAGGVLNITILNLRVDKQTGELTQVRPGDLRRQLKVDRTRLEVGDLNMATNGVITRFEGASSAAAFNFGHNQSGTDVVARQSTQEEFDYYEHIVRDRTLEELGNIPLIGTTMRFAAPNNTVAGNIPQVPGERFRGALPITGGTGRGWNWIATRNFAYYDPRIVLGTDVQVRFDQDEISFANPQGERSVLASRDSNFALLRIGGSTALNATFPPMSGTFIEFLQGATFDERRVTGVGTTTHASPNPPGYWRKEEMIAEIPLPPDASRANTRELIAYIATPVIQNARASVDFENKINRVSMSINAIPPIKGLSLSRFIRNTQTNLSTPVRVGRVVLNAVRNPRLETSIIRQIRNSAIDSASANFWQGMVVNYWIRVNFATSRLEVYREFAMQDQLLRYYIAPRTPSVFNGRTTRINRLGQSEVNYEIPGYSVGLYALLGGEG